MTSISDKHKTNIALEKLKGFERPPLQLAAILGQVDSQVRSYHVA